MSHCDTDWSYEFYYDSLRSQLLVKLKTCRSAQKFCCPSSHFIISLYALNLVTLLSYVTTACCKLWLNLDRRFNFVFSWALPFLFTLRASIWASCWQQCLQSGWSLLRLNSPSRSQELHSRLLEKPSSLHASDDSSAPYADSWREETEGIQF